MNDLNATLASAYDPYRSIFDNALAVATLYLSTWIYASHYEKVRLLCWSRSVLGWLVDPPSVARCQ